MSGLVFKTSGGRPRGGSGGFDSHALPPLRTRSAAVPPDPFPTVIDYLLPIVLFLVPVMIVIALTVGRGRELTGSCGGVSPEGRCTRCGKPAAEMPPPRSAKTESCP